MSEVNKKILPISKAASVAKKIILYGAGGAGKTVSVVTALLNMPEGSRMVCLMTERNSISGLEFGLAKYNIEVKPGQLITTFPEEKKKAFVDFERALTLFENQSKTSALRGDSNATQGKENYGYLNKIIKTLSNFTGTDYATGETVSIGNIGELTSNDILVIDGLSPLGNEIWNSLVGDKLAISQTDYGPPQRAMYLIFSQLAKLECNVILLAHEKEVVDDSGTLAAIKVNTWVGNSSYETMMGLFTDVIYCYRAGTLFKWAGQRNKVYTVARNIPAKDGLEPNFSTHNIF